MPAKGSSNGQGKSDKPAFGDYRFVQYQLSVQEKKEFETWWTATHEDAFVLFDELVSSDHKFSASWDANNDCYVANLTCNMKRSPNYCLILQGRSDTLWEAIGILLFKHLVVFKGEDWAVPTTNKWG